MTSVCRELGAEAGHGRLHGRRRRALRRDLRAASRSPTEPEALRLAARRAGPGTVEAMAESIADRVHVTRSRANPGGGAADDEGKVRLPLAQAALAQGPGARRADLPPPEEVDRAGQPPHRLRGGELPERRRVLGARHGHLHDPRRRLHPALRLLQRADGQADLERPARAAAGREPGQADGPAPRGDHLGRPRRPARLRGRRLRRRDPLDPADGAGLQGRGADPRLPRPGDAARQGDRRAARRLQPQRRDRAAALSDGAPRLRLPALGARPAHGEGDGRRRGGHQVRA